MTLRSSRALVRAPSNIAIIKYMGKLDRKPDSISGANLPANPSLSMTLDSLCTLTEVSFTPGRAGGGAMQVRWQGASELGGFTDLIPVEPASPAERQKLERHVERVVRALRPDLDSASSGAMFSIRSGNRFPSGAGIASSASGYAALTLALAKVLGHAGSNLQSLSRQGSGSSCRSFDGPWVLWEGEGTQAVTSRMPPLADLVLVVDGSPKLVGSSEAHQRVRSSPLWKGRIERARGRLELLKGILERGDFEGFSRLCLEEALDMHELFHTSEPPFSYFKPATRELLSWLGDTRQCAITLDAGPNLHLLVPVERAGALEDRIRKAFPALRILRDGQGRGAEVLEHVDAL